MIQSILYVVRDWILRYPMAARAIGMGILGLLLLDFALRVMVWRDAKDRILALPAPLPAIERWQNEEVMARLQTALPKFVEGADAAGADGTLPVELAEISLMGVFSRQRDRLAAVKLMNDQTSPPKTVRVGDDLAGWQIVAIGPRSLSVRQGEQSHELVVFPGSVSPEVVSKEP